MAGSHLHRLSGVVYLVLDFDDEAHGLTISALPIKKLIPCKKNKHFYTLGTFLRLLSLLRRAKAIDSSLVVLVFSVK